MTTAPIASSEQRVQPRNIDRRMGMIQIGTHCGGFAKLFVSRVERRCDEHRYSARCGGEQAIARILNRDALIGQ